jgi:TonB family protein
LLISDAEVAYPQGAHGEAVVRLVLTVGRDGSVQTVQAVEGEEPFRSAAETAARTWKFEPARRGAEAVPVVCSPDVRKMMFE